MRKLKLNLEQLSVESFEIASRAGLQGTVRGADLYDQLQPVTDPIGTEHTQCAQSNCNTWERTCPACTGIGCDDDDATNP